MTEYTRIIPHPLVSSGAYAVVKVDLPKLSNILEKRDEGRSVNCKFWLRMPEERVLGDFKVQRYQNNTTLIQNGSDIVTPELYVENGQIELMDGRHRLHALLDQGYTIADIFCPVQDEALIKSEIGV